MGNHEYSLIEFLDSRNPSFDLFFLHKMGGMDAIESFLQGVDDSVFNEIELVKRSLKVERKEEIDFINHLAYYFEDEGHIFVHAGVRPRNWRETTPSDFVWIGEDRNRWRVWLFWWTTKCLGNQHGRIQEPLCKMLKYTAPTLVKRWGLFDACQLTGHFLTLQVPSSSPGATDRNAV
ncbi:hypothetical protein ACFVS2_12885 [Brevibacillus sp. NPDC058079]|uniref:hypothetical protein n=1 Tax=Brevibacillus sp. NPDC058079 TaxID=3346330 RepID=UPI0036F127CF